MPKPRPLPPHLRARPFTTSEAIQAGASPRRLRARDLDSSVWGVRAPSLQVTLVQRCALLQLRLPAGAYFSHSTAALLHGLPVPISLESDRTLHVTVPARLRAPHARGLSGHVSSAQDAPMLLHGLPVSPVERSWCDLASQVSWLDLIAAGDFAIYLGGPLTTVESLAHAITTATNPRGRRNQLRAFPLLDGRSESPQESRLRAILVTHGLNPSRIQHVVTDRFGEFVARTDVYLDDLNVILEYQGDYHRTKVGQWRADMTRRSKIEATGPRVMELNADDLRNPRELIARILALAALARR